MDSASFVVGCKALVTVDSWFYAPDGKSYKAIFGTIKGVFTSEEQLGIKANNRTANWFLRVGSVLVAGCQIHYAVGCQSFNSESAQHWTASAENGIKIYDAPCAIYNADNEA